MGNLVRGSWADTVQRLRRSGTRGDANLKPYESAEISLERVPIADLVPTAKYVLKDQLEIVNNLYERSISFGVDIFDLECGVVWPNGPDERPIACPIIELWEGEGLLVVDGLHRVWAAREKGRSEMTCAVIRNVKIPLVPLPVTWRDVRVFPPGQFPSNAEKREYRFADADTLRVAEPSLAAKVTDENARYFLYRNLDELGSSGIRPPATDADSIIDGRARNEGNDEYGS